MSDPESSSETDSGVGVEVEVDAEIHVGVDDGVDVDVSLEVVVAVGRGGVLDPRPVVPPIVLASQSPRRAQLMELIGLPFMVEPADVDETYPAHEEPGAHAERLAREKAQVVAARRPDALVVGSDTVVVVDGEVLGKPGDEEQALAMLMRLQGREHRVLTGVAVAAPAFPAADAPAAHPPIVRVARVVSGVESVRVWFRAFDEATAREYIGTGEPMDKAGAYGIQGYGATIVERVDGDYFAVMGLALGRMIGLFRELGWRYNFRGLEPL